MNGAATVKLLEEHLDNDHHWDSFAYDDGDILYLINAHETIHRVDAQEKTA